MISNTGVTEALVGIQILSADGGVVGTSFKKRLYFK
jgi:predicted TIM-barrel enzyme